MVMIYGVQIFMTKKVPSLKYLGLVPGVGGPAPPDTSRPV